MAPRILTLIFEGLSRLFANHGGDSITENVARRDGGPVMAQSEGKDVFKVGSK
jgi:hypothetical protein